MTFTKAFLNSVFLATLSCTDLLSSQLTATDILRNFNVVVSGNLSTGHDIEGRTVIGGNLTRGATFNSNPGPGASSEYRALTVYGNSTATDPIAVNNGGGATIVGTTAGLVNLNGGGSSLINGVGTSAPDPLPDFASAFGDPIAQLSAQLAAFVPNSTFPSNDEPDWPNNVALRASSGSGLAIFSITTAQLSQLASLYVDLNGRDGAIFNVYGTSYNQSLNFQQPVTVAHDILWNFTEATDLSFSQWGGTILAPNALVTTSSALEGGVFAASFIGNGEVHSRPFRPDIPDADVPEPASVLLVGAGVAALAASRKWR
ncbi:MAG TPA: choice-of-anchor A family protein [Bryobacteraceae bacterium]|nr:choice-of-anchor A family protein [Bryobacteraceae bacterium]